MRIAETLYGVTLTPELLSYVEAALWSSNDESTPAGGEPMDSNYSLSDLAPETLQRMAKDVAEFQAANLADIEAGCDRSGEHSVYEMAAHDFWLTRNGHGAGFWDGDWMDADSDTPEARGERLSEAARAFGQFDLYVGDDGQIYA